jgi:DsbC/DsbD-like thiol-disulfide interchange protein
MHRLISFIIAALIVLPAFASARAQEHSQVALLDAGPFPGAERTARLAAVVIRLKDGWKTYWRVPGEGGAPPRFDFSGSENVRDAKVLYPAPKRFADPVTGKSIGYKEEVAFPLNVVLKEPKKPARLKLKLDLKL